MYSEGIEWPQFLPISIFHIDGRFALPHISAMVYYLTADPKTTGPIQSVRTRNLKSLSSAQTFLIKAEYLACV